MALALVDEPLRLFRKIQPDTVITKKFLKVNSRHFIILLLAPFQVLPIAEASIKILLVI